MGRASKNSWATMKGVLSDSGMQFRDGVGDWLRREPT